MQVRNPMWRLEQAGTSPSVVIVRPEGSGATSLLSKGHFLYGGNGNVEDISVTNQNYSPGRFSDSVLTEIQLQSLLIDWKKSAGEFIALPVTLTSGDVAIANFNTTVWPAWIRKAISERLLAMGGVPSVSALQIQKDSKGNPFVLPVMKPATKSTVSLVEPATADDDPESSPTSSSPPTEQKPSDTWKPCPPGTHDWLTRNGTTYCWLCGIESHSQ
jgi:hypothetical protein